jgi:hypothetical protein
MFDVARYEVLRAWKPDLVIIATRWSQRHYNGLDDKRELLEYLGELDSKVLLMQQPPELSIGNSNTSQYFTYLRMGDTLERNSVSMGNLTDYEKGLQLVNKITYVFPYVEVFKVTPRFRLGEKRVLVRSGREIFYYDDDHLSQQGALLFKEQLREAISTALDK